MTSYPKDAEGIKYKDATKYPDGLVLCEDSYSGGEFPQFEGIASRPILPEQIYSWADDPAS